MNYSLGFAFSAKDLFCRFPYKKLKLTCADCKRLTSSNHRDRFVALVFTISMEIIIKDIIERNVTFWLPLHSNRKCNLHMSRIHGKQFQNLRRKGKWADVDIVSSNFSGYEIGFYMLGRRTPRVKYVYLSKPLSNLITKYTNQGKAYGDCKIETTLSDYYEIVSREFSGVQLSDIKLIIDYAWKQLYIINSYGCDFNTKRQSTKFWCYIGTIKSNAKQHFEYYIYKLCRKIKFNYMRQGYPWDGYYYCALTESLYQKYKKQVEDGKTCDFELGKVKLYQILEECKIANYYSTYIFKVQVLKRTKLKIITVNPIHTMELIEIRQCLQFKNIMTSINEYKYV